MLRSIVQVLFAGAAFALMACNPATAEKRTSWQARTTTHSDQ